MAKMCSYNDLAARLRGAVTQMNTVDIAHLEEQSDFIESIKTYLKKHDRHSLNILGQRLQEYSIVDLAEFGSAVSNSGDLQARAAEEEWASLVTPQGGQAYTSISGGEGTIGTQMSFALSMNIGDDGWNFTNPYSVHQHDAELLDSIVPFPPTERPDLHNIEPDSYSISAFSATYLPEIKYDDGGASKAKKITDPPSPLHDLVAHFSRPKAEEIMQAAKSFIRSDLQQFLDTFLPVWQDQGLWGNNKLELFRGSDTSHDRLESAYQCLTHLGPNMADDPVRSRMASITLYREFQAACTGLKERTSSQRHTAQRGRGVASLVIDYTLRRIYKDFDQLPLRRQKELRADFNDSIRFGKRWQKLASSIGYGVLLVCSKAVTAVINKTTFTDAMLDSLADTVRNHMPECWRVITELDQLAISILGL